MFPAHLHSAVCGCFSRRRLAASLGGVLALAAAGIPAAGAQTLTRAARDAMTPDQVLAEMLEGNARFRAGQQRPRDWMAQQRAAASGQYPKAVLLSCIDSRAPAEIVTDMGLGDIFNSRIAGNVHDQAVLGGMEFACKLAGAKLVLVMGHSACGAVAGAIAGAELGNLTALLARIRPAVGETTFAGDRSATNYAFVDAVARTNVALTVAGIRKDSPVLAELERAGAIKIAGAMYDLATGAITVTA